VVVSPHLDDAVLSAWLVLRRSPRARVVTCFAGLPESGAVGSWDGAGPRAVEARRAEDLRALAMTGSEPVHLDLLDAQYRRGSEPAREHHPEGAHPDQADEEELVARLAAALEPHLRSADEVWLPAALGGHVDHALTRRAALAAGSEHALRHVYADLPYGGQPAWPVRIAPGPRNAAVALASRALGAPTPADRWGSVLAEIPGLRVDSVTVQRLNRMQRRSKYAAVREYASQLAALRCGPRNLLRRRRIFAYEVSWTVSSSGSS
jgi:LmbE family N-acetylglucosaminyl deacetylase